MLVREMLAREFPDDSVETAMYGQDFTVTVRRTLSDGSLWASVGTLSEFFAISKWERGIRDMCRQIRATLDAAEERIIKSS